SRNRAGGRYHSRQPHHFRPRRQCPDRLWRPGHAGAIQRDGLARPVLQLRCLPVLRTATMRRSIPSIALALAALLASGPAFAERIKDLAQVAGVRGNALVGYGLVVGLDGSGDRTSQTPFTVQSLKAMLDQLGVSIPPGVNPQTKNVAA